MNLWIQIPNGHDLEAFEQISRFGNRRQQRGHDHHRPRVFRDCSQELHALKPARRDESGDETLDERDRHFARGHQEEQRDPDVHQPELAELLAQVRQFETAQGGCDQGDGAKVDGGGVTQDEPLRPLPGARPIAHIELEVSRAVANEVIPDVGGAIGHRADFRRLLCALDRS